jgi:hypothetical protein
MSNRYRRFNQPEVAPEEVSTAIKMSIGDIDHRKEDFNAYLIGETITSYTITPTDGLTITNKVNEDTYLTYTVEVKDSASPYETITFQITTSEGRVYKRVIEFEVS